jgi:tether containing UBX domain for GLUT4
MSQEPEQIADAPAPIELEPAVTTSPQPEASVPEPQNEIKVFSAPVASTSAVETPKDEGESSKTCTSPLFSVLRRKKRMRADVTAEINDAYFEPSLSDVQSYHATVISRSKRLNEAPLLTSKHRDEEKAVREKKKAEKWPTVRLLRNDTRWNEADG